jgi:hypothetical protein
LAPCRRDRCAGLHGNPGRSCTTKRSGKPQFDCQRELRGAERALAPPLLVALRPLALPPPACVSILLWITVLLRSGVWNLYRAATPPSAPLALVIAQEKSLIRAGVSRPFFMQSGQNSAVRTVLWPARRRSTRRWQRPPAPSMRNLRYAAQGIGVRLTTLHSSLTRRKGLGPQLFIHCSVAEMSC